MMKIFFKLLFSIFVSLLFCGESLALSMKGLSNEDFNSSEAASAYAYFEDYSKRIYEVLEPRKIRKKEGQGLRITFTLNRDGTVSNVKDGYLDAIRVDNSIRDRISYKIPKGYQYAMEVVKNLKPIPFPNDIEDESIDVKLEFANFKTDRINLDNHQEYGLLMMRVYKKHRLIKSPAPFPLPRTKIEGTGSKKSGLKLSNVMNEDFHSPKYANAYAYFEDYSKRLYEDFQPKKAGWRIDDDVKIIYTLPRYGKVNSVRAVYSDGSCPRDQYPLYKKIPKEYLYAMDVVQKLKPVHFPNDIKDDELRMEVSFRNDNEDSINLDARGIKKDIAISISKTNRHKNGTPAPKPVPHSPPVAKGSERKYMRMPTSYEKLKSPEYANIYEYFENYSKRLYTAMDPRKIHRPEGKGVQVEFYMDRNGRMLSSLTRYYCDDDSKDRRKFLYKIPPNARYATNLIEDLKPIALPENLSWFPVRMQVLFQDSDTDEIYVDPGERGVDIDILIKKKIRHKNIFSLTR